MLPRQRKGLLKTVNVCYYPAFLNITGKICVVIGGGKVAERKVKTILGCGAKIKLISPKITIQLEKEKQKGNLEHLCRNYESGDLEGAFLVIAATSDEKVNKKIASEARCLVNVVDAPEIANFIVPSVVKRGLMNIAVSTSGVSPALARSVRKEIESLYDSELNKYLIFLKKLRKQVIRKISDKKIRQQFFREIASEEVLKFIRQKGYKEAKDIALRRLHETASL